MERENRKRKVIAFVGSGGKTTLIHKLAKEYVKKGMTVLVTTTTHMGMEPDTLVTDNAQEIIERLERDGYCMACAPQKGITSGSIKLGKLSDEVYEQACLHADIVLVEADGSRQLPMKCPNETEPVIPSNVDEIRVVIGLSALGRIAKEICHRPEWLADYGIEKEEKVCAADIQKVLTDGYLKPLRAAYPQAEVRIEPYRISNLYDRAVSRFLSEEQDVSVLKEEWFSTQPKLVICGAGHVGVALWQIARVVGFDITLIDDRKDFLKKETFSDTTLICCDYEEIEKHFPKEENAYCVIVTHGHKGDLSCAKAALKQPFAYIGMIGSRNKVAYTLGQLAEAGYTKEQCGRLHAPIGLRIGAKTPQEIAVSIMAEMIQVKSTSESVHISAELREALQAGVLCIVTKKNGSSPGNVGCMMLVSENGAIGTVGGGSLEKSVIQEAKGILKIQTRHYNVGTSNEDGLGMVCGGSNDILFIPLEECEKEETTEEGVHGNV